MSYEIVMPRLGWNMEEGTLVEWLKRDGETVNQGETVCTIEGDKTATDIESFETGILKIPETSPQPGRTVPVGTLLGYIVSEHEADTFPVNSEGGSGLGEQRVPGEVGSVIDSAPRLSAEKTVPDKAEDTETADGVGQAHESESAAGRRRNEPAISPRARRAAKASGVDWRLLQGSGRMGRIVERDVLAAAAGRVEGVGDAAVAGTSDASGNLRQVIAHQMVESHLATAPVTLTTEVDTTALSTRTTDTFQPSWYDLMVKIAGAALAEHPLLNAAWRNGVVLNERIHIGIAVDTREGVIVPVIRDVPDKTLRDVAAESRRLVDAARSEALTLDQLQDGTFTLTNLGMYEIDAFTPIIHLPQCAILGLGRVTPRLVVLDEAGTSTGIRRIMPLSLTFDHRIVDGAPAARFLQRIKHLVEEPDPVFDEP